MARILEAQRGGRSRSSVGYRPAQTPSVEAEEDSGVPFVEVGAPMPNAPARSAAAPMPSIIPLPRPMPPEPTIADDSQTLRVIYQPLPFPRPPMIAAEQRFARDLVAFHHPAHSASEQYRRLVSEIEAHSEHGTPKSMVLMAAHRGAGATTVVLNMALTYARRDIGKVIVVDANFARPAIANALGVGVVPGLREVLSRTVPLSWAIQHSGFDNLNVLPSGERSVEAAMDLWPIVLDQLCRQYQIVLIDAAEWSAAESRPLVGTAQSTILVVDQDRLDAPELNDLHNEIPQHGGSLRGCILTSH